MVPRRSYQQSRSKNNRQVLADYPQGSCEIGQTNLSSNLLLGSRCKFSVTFKLMGDGKANQRRNLLLIMNNSCNDLSRSTDVGNFSQITKNSSVTIASEPLNVDDLLPRLETLVKSRAPHINNEFGTRR
jgi:hypothetical protein